MTQQRTPVDEIFYPELGPQRDWTHPGDPVAEREHRRRNNRAVEEAGAPPKVRAMTDEELAAGERAFAERLAAQAGGAPFWRR